MTTATALPPTPAGLHASGPVPPRVLTRRDAAVALALSAVALVATRDAWRDILRLGYGNEELSYVLLAPVMITWIVWSRRDQLVSGTVTACWGGLLVLLFGWGVYYYGFIADPVLWRAGAVTVLAGAVVSALGLGVLWRLAPAFAAMIFLIPISPDGRYRVALPLQNATAEATQTICDLLGFYVDRAGNLLTINGIDVTIAEACNGMRMVFTLFLVCYVVAFTVPMRVWLRVVLLLATPLVAVVANVVRLVPTVWLFGNASAEVAGQFHDVSGWVMTVVAFLLLMGFFRWLESLSRAAEREADGENPGAGAGVGTSAPGGKGGA